MHGDMAWLARNPDRRTDARRVLPEARSLVVVGLNYYQPHPPAGYRIANTRWARITTTRSWPGSRNCAS
jgi:epoxyqueuosine reductase